MPAIGPDNIREYLTAFADGELDAADTLAVLDFVIGHPDALEFVRDQQRLRLAAARAFRASSPPVPDDVRRRIEAMTPDLPSESAAHSPPAVRRPRRAAPALAAAALLLLGGMLAGHFAFPPTPSSVPPVAASEADAVPATLVVHASRVHADCSRLAVALHTAGYPAALADLASLVRADFRSAGPYPDLSALGFRFVGAGPCAAPLADTAHLLYVSTGPGHRRAISVFARRYDGQPALEHGKFYAVSGPRSTFPAYAWRTAQVVYVLIGDDEADVATARAALATTLGL